MIIDDHDSATELVKSIRPCCEQSRAEVLAAVLADVDIATAIYAENKDRPRDERLAIGGVCLGIKFRLQQLQPAAKDLEELLREAKIGELHRLLSACEGLDDAVVDLRPEIELRIAELEKARAIVEKK
jgi:hypothetical protein